MQMTLVTPVAMPAVPAASWCLGTIPKRLAGNETETARKDRGRQMEGGKRENTWRRRTEERQTEREKETERGRVRERGREREREGEKERARERERAASVINLLRVRARVRESCLCY